jgi:two-component system chemotaxis sensor kinase CheA
VRITEHEQEAVAEVPLAVVASDEPPAAQGQPGAARKQSQTVRVDAERLDSLMHCMGELVVQRTLVEALAAQADVPGLAQAMQELTRSSHALQAMVMQIRMIPVDAVFMRFPRLVRDVASRLEKQVELQVIGKETELDRTVVDAIGDPLVHLIRNSLDHGLERPEERIAAGKPPAGTLTIAARHAGGSIVITVKDDGRGIDPAKVAAVAVKRGIINADQAALVDVKQAIELLFAPGFSTADEVGDLSGRGVGMDAVREKLRELGGEVTVTSVTGEGTENEIRLPLTLAIVSALLIEAGGRPFGIPLQRVERTMLLEGQAIRSVAGQKMLLLDDEALPLVSASTLFGGAAGSGAEPDTHVVIVRGQDRNIALSVSRLVGQVELVTRPLPAGSANGGPVSGAAVLSSGDIVLIADCDAMSQVQSGRGAADHQVLAAA